jgi:hypothetical protein
MFSPYANKLLPSSSLFIIIIIIINFLFVIIIIIIIIEQRVKETPSVVLATNNEMSCDESCLHGRLIWEMVCRLN